MAKNPGHSKQLTESFDLSSEVEFTEHPKEIHPDLHLRLEVLGRAIYDAAGHVGDIQHHNRKQRRRERKEARAEARAWINSNNQGSMTFRDICETLGLNCARVRHVAKLVQGGQFTPNVGRVGNNLQRLFG